MNAGGIIPQSGIINANLAKVNISCSSGLYLALSQGIRERIQIYDNIINLNLSTNISGELNVSKLTSSSLTTNTINTSNISSNNMSILNDLTVAGDLTTSNISATNISVSNDLTVAGVLNAPNIDLGGLTTLTIGSARMGTNGTYANFASFGSALLANTSINYALGQSTTGTFINGASIRFRTNNNEDPLKNMFYTSAGNLGIGTDNPYARLHLYSNSVNTDMFLGGPIGVDKIGILKYIQGNGSGNGQVQIGHYGQPNPLGFQFNYNGDAGASRNMYSNYSAMGYNNKYGTNFGSFSNKLHIYSTQKYMALHENGGDTYLNGYNFLRLRIRNQDRLYVDNNGAYLADGTAISSDDRLKFEEQDISGLSIMRQLNPKKYIKIDLPYVKKRRRYYDEYEVSIIDDYIYDICQNEVDKINQERRDISLNDLSYNDYYRDEDYIHKDKITEEDVNAFVSQEDISNGHFECGLIAQEVLETDISWVVHQQHIPEDIQKPLFQPLSIRYDDIYPYCIQAIKELDVLLQKQTNQYNELDVIVQGLRDKVNNLEAENDILLGRLEAGGL